MTAEEIDRKLQSGNPSVHTRPNQLSLGVMLLDVRPLVPGDKELIVEKLRGIMSGNR